MKKILLLSLLLSSLVLADKIAIPMPASSLAIENSGQLSAIDAYQDGVGIYTVEQIGSAIIDNSEMNSLVYKYGAEAKAADVNIKDYILSSGNVAEKVLAGELGKFKPITLPNGSSCANGNGIIQNNECMRLDIQGDDNAGRKWFDNTYAASCNEYKNNLPVGKNYKGNIGDGYYLIDVKQNNSNIQKVYCDMTTDGGGWTMWYSTNDKYSIYNSTLTTSNYGTNTYSKDLRDMPFNEIIYDNFSNSKHVFKKNSTSKIKIRDYMINSVISVSGSRNGLWTGSNGANQSYSYQLTIGDKTWMDIGLMITGYTNCWKVPGSWCGDTSSNYYRINGENTNTYPQYQGTRFGINGHVGSATKNLIGIGIR